KKVLSNDELLYDPDMDDNDESWVIKQINSKGLIARQYILIFSRFRHEKFANQFRAMFVHNCHAIKNERYKYEDEYYYKVVCDNCGIQVAMMEEDEIYHFFNVVPT
ncbi:hypothetical protein BDF20DRAFT_830558, partial [Mycotypha africana]|uniref:uncharacterized protein n=1 Tax=Mycotypha africana TaxID=64632 RepID=UPI002300C9CD